MLAGARVDAGGDSEELAEELAERVISLVATWVAASRKGAIGLQAVVTGLARLGVKAVRRLRIPLARQGFVRPFRLGH